MRKLSVAVSAAILALTAVTATAQAQQKAQTQQKAEAPAPNTLPPGAIAAAKEILVLKNASSVYQGAVVSTIQNVKNSLLQSNINLQRDIEEISLKLARDLSGKESEIGEGMAAIYATHFSEQELKDLLAFYKSPLGKKSLEQEPKSIEASLNYMRNWGEDLALEVNEMFRQELKKRGKDL
ncbi:DUF2059 domain-containing protein [Bradyrhizobium sp. LHD-71]|uniref:DUF2059 domain-containing protein n=1 Tax=Bradyrhizobium sp. LHD-71 TaxID=3072141 RepID=UPI00280E317F|nr:DUF2059 domain-containing protein [Bradyrhizobium sp. LHD-71]MDQ8728638.1 DUF2059 domain-containing protein [Bradyrhizobium sp. LHD-71]